MCEIKQVIMEDLFAFLSKSFKDIAWRNLFTDIMITYNGFEIQIFVADNCVTVYRYHPLSNSLQKVPLANPNYKEIILGQVKEMGKGSYW